MSAKTTIAYIKRALHIFWCRIVDRKTKHEGLQYHLEIFGRPVSVTAVDCSCGKSFFRYPGYRKAIYPDHWLTKEAAKAQEDYFRAIPNPPEGEL